VPGRAAAAGRRAPPPAKRLTPMGLLAGESACGWCDFRRKVGTFI